MPVLGAGGVLELRRELPEPVVLSPEAAAVHASALSVDTEGFWTGDKVWVWGPLGLPFDLNGDGLPDVTGGWGMFYGSRYLLYGERGERLTSGDAKWFGPEDPFRAPEIDGLVDRTELYVYRDSLDRLSFYRTLNGALGGELQDRLTLYNVDFRLLLIAPAGSSGYQQRLEPAYLALSAFRLPADRTELPLPAITDAALPEPEGPDDDRPWLFIAEMDGWSLELDAADIDTSAMGERFSESVRAQVSGGGRLDFFVNRHQHDQETDATFLARLLIILEQGSTGEAVFHVTKKSSNLSYQAGDRRLPTANVAYKAKLLLTNCVTDTSAEDVIRGSARFVTVGRIRLDIS